MDDRGRYVSPGKCLPAPRSDTGRPTRALAALYNEHSDLWHLTEVLEPSLSFLSFVNWIFFSGDTRAVGTGILGFQILLVNNYFQYFAPNVLHRGPLAGKKYD